MGGLCQEMVPGAALDARAGIVGKGAGLSTTAPGPAHRVPPGAFFQAPHARLILPTAPGVRETMDPISGLNGTEKAPPVLFRCFKALKRRHVRGAHRMLLVWQRLHGNCLVL